MPELTVDLLPAQMRFIQAKPPKGTHRVFELMYSGAFGAGKSRALCLKAVLRAMRKGAFEGLTRKTLAEFRRTTLRTLLEQDEDLPPVLPKGTYSHHKTEHIIRLRGGGTIHYFGCDDPDTVKSLGLSGCGIDESTELDEQEYLMLLGRVRVGKDLQLYSATNPGGKSHFLYKRFRVGDDSRRPPERVVIHTKTVENWFLPAAYQGTLAGFTGQYRERYVEGVWGNFEGMVYANWKPSIYVSRLPKPSGYNYAGVDDGFTNPFCVEVAVHDHERRLHFCEEFYQSGLSEDEKVKTCLELAQKHKVMTFYVDPSAAGLIQAMRSTGLDVKGANHDVLGGIGKVQQRMAVGNGGGPGVTYSPRCTNLIEQKASYAWQEGKDAPVKTNDHAVDAERYLIASLDARPAPLFGSGVADEPDKPHMRMDNEELWEE